MNITNSWADFLAEQAEQPYYQSLQLEIKKQREAGLVIYPEEPEVFNAFKLTDLTDIKVVILGQDPYHGAGQAHGLSFSVKPGQKIPPSLRNMFKELVLEFPDFVPPKHGDLSAWAKQGVLLINAVLTVQEASANSHKDLGWHQFTDNVIQHINEQCDGVVFLLWGAFAQKKSVLINESKHTVLTTAHPSPLSARRGFFGCDHFKRTNEILEEKGKSKINWRLP